MVGGLLIVGLSAFFFWRRNRQSRTREAATAAAAVSGTGANPGSGNGKPELDGAVSPPSPSSSPSTAKTQPLSRIENVSPVSADATRPPASELHAQAAAGPQMAELSPQGLTAPPGAGRPARPELQGHNAYQTTQVAASTVSPTTSPSAFEPQPQEAAGRQVYEAPVRHPTQVHEMHGQSSTNWRSGPVSLFHEVEGSRGPAHTPR